MNRSKSALAVLLLTSVAAAPAGAEQASVVPSSADSQFCAGCFAYLEFPPSLQSQWYATRGQAPDQSATPPAAHEGSGHLRAQTAGLVADSKQ